MVAAGTTVALLDTNGMNVWAEETPTTTGPVDLVAVVGGEPDEMFRKAIAELGGMSKFVQKGQKVVMKPNAAWDKTPEMAANTNPALMKEMVKQALEAGAAEVIVFDHACDDWRKAYKNSGIEDAVLEAGGKMVPADQETYYREVSIPNGKKLKSAKVHQAILDCDVWFNVPIVKTHVSTKMTIAMKNLMGIVWDRQVFHKNDLEQSIADSVLLVKKPALNVVDGYRVMKTNGPRGQSVADAVVMKGLFISPDMVAVDAAAIKFAQQATQVALEDVAYVAHAEKMKLGTSKLDSLNVKRIRL